MGPPEPEKPVYSQGPVTRTEKVIERDESGDKPPSALSAAQDLKLCDALFVLWGQ